jgi:hypothetical protein
MIFDGESISLDPSIGNWSFPCRSHYWVKRNNVHWARSWSKEEIDAGREDDRVAKQLHFEQSDAHGEKVDMPAEPASTRRTAPTDTSDGGLERLWKWWRNSGRSRR